MSEFEKRIRQFCDELCKGLITEEELTTLVMLEYCEDILKPRGSIATVEQDNFSFVTATAANARF